jgi:hypothetical protein
MFSLIGKLYQISMKPDRCFARGVQRREYDVDKSVMSVEICIDE